MLTVSRLFSVTVLRINFKNTTCNGIGLHINMIEIDERNFTGHLRILIVLILVFVIFSSCKSTSGSSAKKSSGMKNEGSNNTLVQTSSHTVANTRSNDEIIFEGSNNLFELVQKNAAYFDGAHDVIIIKGDGNVIKLININILTLPKGSPDTLVIVGNNQKYVIDVNNSIVPGKKNVKVDTIDFKSASFEPLPEVREVIPHDSRIRLDYFDSLVSAQYAYTYFADKINTGEPEYYYQLAEMYLYGLGVEESPAKAIELYEFAAAKDHILSLRKLGDIYRGKFSMKPNKDKSLYYYRRGQRLGDLYCDERIHEFNTH